MRRDDTAGWHLDKRVPLGIIAAMVMQFAGSMWFVSKLDSRLLALEMAQMRQNDRDDRQDRAAESAVGLVRGDLQELSRKLDRLLERQSGR